MFWKFDLHTTSHIDTLLEKEDVTLTEVMDEEDVLQECKSQNHKLVDFLVRPQCMEDLVSYITQEPNDDVEEKIKYKYPNISCELLTSDVSQINDMLGEDENLLMKLYSFLQNEPPLNPLLASFFSKVLSILIGRKPEQIVEFLRKREDFVDLLIKHIGTSAIMDLLLRMLTCIEPQQLRQDVLNWLNEEKVIQRLVDMVQPSQDEDRHSNASQSLCEIIRLSRDQMFQVQGCSEPDPLLATLEKQETVEQLLSNIFDKEKNESAIVSVIQILLTLFETRRPAFEGHLEICPSGMNHPSFSVNQSILDAVRPRLKDFHQLLLEPPKKTVLNTTWGVLDPPVGNTRLNVVRLVTSLLQTNTHIINQELIALNTLGVILDMYFKYLWNNFLHTQVEICTAMILAMPSTQSESPEINRENDQEPIRENILIKHLFQKCQLIQRILDAWGSNEKEQTEGGRRRGYMGHLTRIANSIVHNSDKGPNGTQIQQLLSELPEEDRERWEAFTSGQLADTNKKNTVDLVNTHHIHSSSDDEVDFKDSGFHQDSSIQQAFSDYQMQQMTSNFIEQFGFNDEEFADQDDVGDIPFDRISDINFSLNTNESANMALFEACCKEKIQQFEDAGSDEEDIWDEKDVTFAPEAQRRPRSSGSTDSEDSTDSEEEDGKRDPFESTNATSDDRMEVDSGDGSVWTANFDDIPMDTGSSTAPSAPVSTSQTAVPEPSGWNSPNTAANAERGWADFSSFTPVSPKDPLRSNSPVAMETSIETDPLGVNAPMQQENTEEWLPNETTPTSPRGRVGDGLDPEEEPVSDRITETVTNGSMKETVSLTVDAKTETAIFKSEEETRSTSDDASAKLFVAESGEVEKSSCPPSNCQKPGLKHLEEQAKSTCKALNGPLEDAAAMDEAKSEQCTANPETAVNGPA
ncbi:serine/threonine-protein phosphatase 6 regulatory subunit 3 isoform X2 [Carassius gibelio]|uniref:serine/threonine-protein phosphatase 6 regulatory subunit 3 isoform X2 n=1 Tax=Carassius gibelio TaxID=101364 RepID=UPI00227976DA|nr:serine/threonine-protein phosphatase 6 regulatory subunit 3 isoform X2 [Carassius gibelio]XP_052399922.1 serine/threonine-protein phosphatase 6 regulatory subunit 3 isoform X2 [Carassius gibelio]